MRTITIALLFVVTSPTWMLACEVCGLASPAPNQAQYISMSVMLSAVPLSMFAGVGFWLYRRVKAADATPVPSQISDAPAESHVSTSLG